MFQILPALVNFKPDFIFVSAGFDAHKKVSSGDSYKSGVTPGSANLVRRSNQ
jgi:hypothetical protein